MPRIIDKIERAMAAHPHVTEMDRLLCALCNCKNGSYKAVQEGVDHVFQPRTLQYEAPERTVSVVTPMPQRIPTVVHATSWMHPTRVNEPLHAPTVTSRNNAASRSTSTQHSTVTSSISLPSTSSTTSAPLAPRPSPAATIPGLPTRSPQSLASLSATALQAGFRPRSTSSSASFPIMPPPQPRASAFKPFVKRSPTKTVNDEVSSSTMVATNLPSGSASKNCRTSTQIGPGDDFFEILSSDDDDGIKDEDVNSTLALPLPADVVVNPFSEAAAAVASTSAGIVTPANTTRPDLARDVGKRRRSYFTDETPTSSKRVSLAVQDALLAAQRRSASPATVRIEQDYDEDEDHEGFFEDDEFGGGYSSQRKR